MNDLYPVQKYTRKNVNLEISLPGSKSITNRALILAALADGTTKLSNFLISEDTVYMSRALKDVGIHVSYDESKKECRVEGGVLPSGDHGLFVGNAGTAMRFLTSYLNIGRGHFVLDGDERMRQRPVEDLLISLRQLGCNVTSRHDNACPPVLIRARGIPGGNCKISGKNSSQYLSSILMASPYANGDVTVETEGELSSKPYVDMTVKMMENFGGELERKDYLKYKVKTGKYQAQDSYRIEPDASAASYFLAAAAVLSGKIKIQGIGKNSIQGDARFGDILAKMGCNVQYFDDGMVLESNGKLKGIDVDMNSIPDMVLTLAVTALFADGPTKISNVANLRIKESDRISALAAELKKIGAEVVEENTGLTIIPAKKYRPAKIETYHDHRIAMAFSIAGLKISGIEIINPACVSKTFPEYFTYLEQYLK